MITNIFFACAHYTLKMRFYCAVTSLYNIWGLSIRNQKIILPHAYQNTKDTPNIIIKFTKNSDGLNGLIACELAGLAWNNFVKVIGFFLRFHWNIPIVRGYLFEHCKQTWGTKLVVTETKEPAPQPGQLGPPNVMMSHTGHSNGWPL